jgi:hypothetical protein
MRNYVRNNYPQKRFAKISASFFQLTQAIFAKNKQNFNKISRRFENESFSFNPSCYTTVDFCVRASLRSLITG